MQETNIYTGLYQMADSLHNELCILADDLWNCPELGYQEYRTSERLLKSFQTLPVDIKMFTPLTGFCATLDMGVPGPTIAVLCDMDAASCPEHPDAEQETGTVHCCGHHIQMTAVYGAAKVLACSGVQSHLCGKIKFIAVPAEEYVNLEYRRELYRKNVIEFLGGKSELMKRGVFDGVDAVIAIHSLPMGKQRFALCTGLNGFQVVVVDIYGKAGDFSSNPSNSINALDAAQLGMSALNAWRATFKADDAICVNPIITSGGETMNAVPGHVRMEILVRGNSREAISNTMEKVKMAFSGCSQALGARVEFTFLHSYAPFKVNKEMNWVARSVTKNISGYEAPEMPPGHGTTDLGDLSMMMPTILSYVSGCSGSLHSPEFRVTDSTCYSDGAKLISGIVTNLLVDSGSFVKWLKKEKPPLYPTKEEYLEDARYCFRKNNK